MARGETAVWAVEGLPLKIEYAAGVLEEIRAAAVVGFYRFPRGGLEIGGLLFGVAEGNAVRVLAARPVACEYLHGPSYTLSEKDEVLLRRMLHAPAVDPPLAGLQTVGWYHSHTRSGISLSEQDLNIHNRYFPRYWQVALVVRPQSYGSTRAGFFVREADGTLRTESSYLEFDIPEPAAGTHAPAAEEPEPAPAPAAQPELPPLPSNEYPPPQPRSSGWKWAFAAVAIALLAVAAILVPHRQQWLARTPPPGLSLRVHDLDGALDIGWNPAAAAIRDARAASLEILDGSDQVELPLSRSTLLEGRFGYVRHSPSVEVRLKVLPSDGTPAEESVRVSGKPPAPPPSPAVETAPPPPSPVAETAPPPAPPVVRTPEPPSRNEPKKPAEPAPRLAARRSFSLAQLAARGASSSPVSRLPEPPLPSTPSAVIQGAPAVLEPARTGAPPPPRPAEPSPVRPGYSGPTSGRIIWTGQLPKGARLVIDGQNASSGSLSGRLPGVPVHVSAHPAELSSRGLAVYIYNPAGARRESAGARNGWNDTSFEWDPQHAAALSVVETPSLANNWKRMVVRASRASISVIIIEWQLLEPQP